LENILVSLIGSLIVFDTSVAFQFLISQPLIACTLLGWILGDAQLGMQVGFIMQLLWLGDMPVGASKIPEGNIASLVVTALIIRYSQVFENFNTILIVAIFYGIFLSYVGSETIIWFRKFNTFLLQKLIGYVKKGNFHALSAINVIALISHYIVMFLLILVALIIGDFLYSYFYLIPTEWEMFFKKTVFVILGIGVGLIAPVFIQRFSKMYVAAGMIIGVIIFFIMN